MITVDVMSTSILLVDHCKFNNPCESFIPSHSSDPVSTFPEAAVEKVLVLLWSCLADL